MVYICNICKKEFRSNTLEDLEEFCKHVAKCPIRSNDFLKERFACMFCGNVVRLKKSFKDHLLKCKHSTDCNTNISSPPIKKIIISKEKPSEGLNNNGENIEVINVSSNGKSSNSEPLNDPQVNVQEPHHYEQDSIRYSFENEILNITAKVFSRCNVSMDGAESVVKDFGEILNTASDYFRNEMFKVAQLLPVAQKDTLEKKATYVADKIKASLNAFSTEQKLTTFLKKKRVLELPLRKVYNEKVMQIGDSLKTVKSEAILLPIEHQLRTFLEKPQILESILNYQSKLESSTEGNFSHYLNSTHWKSVKEKFQGKCVIPMFLYNDDFAPDDGLSPHGGSNKVSAYYCGFPSLPPHFRSLTENIHVLMLAKSDEIKEVGANKLLGILAKALLPFEQNGIVINGRNVHILPVLLIGDNMGLNLNLGYMSHAATFYCRFCFMKKSEAQYCCQESQRVLRTQTHYSECLENISNGDKNYGVQSKCDLEILTSFQVTQNYVVDIMHDLLSGVFLYDIKELIKKGIDDKLFTLQEFNQAKNGFDYGIKETGYRMEDVKMTNEGYSVRCHAREMLCLVKFLPFILSKILPHEHSLYKFSILMVDLQDMALKSSFTSSDLNSFDATITKHHKEFQKLFSRNLTPKFHNLLHYTRVIKNCGPLKELWSMRFESKHQILKTQSRVMHSRRNICFSYAKKICFQNAYNALTNSDVMTLAKSYTNKDTPFLTNFQEELTNYDNCERINYSGSVYSSGNFIISSCETFAYKIIQLGLGKDKNKLKLITEKYALKYVKSLRSFQILDPINLQECLDVTSFNTPPINKHLFEGKQYLRKEDF